MNNNRPNNVRKGGDRKNQSNTHVETNDENKQPSQNSAKNGVRQTDKRNNDGKKASETSSTVSLPKGSQATAEQLRMAQLSQVGASDVVLSEMIKQVRELTGCSEDDAVTALHDTGNDPEAAINLVLEGGANKSEWETTGKKGKKKPKAKVEEPVNDSGLENPVFGGYVRGPQTSSNRGRGAQRNTSSRGGRGGGAPSAPRGLQPDDSANYDGGSQRPFPPPGDRPASPKGPRSNREDDARGRSTLDSKKPEPQERIWNEDADDDWKETIKETKVFTRSAPTTTPTSGSLPQPIPSRVQQPAAVGTSNSPSFSAMVQKQSQQTAWTNPSVTPSAPVPQRPPGNDAANWKQPQPSLAPTLTQKPVSSVGATVDHAPVGPSAVQSTVTSATPHKEPAPQDVGQQLGLQFGSMSFNRTPSYESRPEQPSQTSIPSQSQTFNSRTALTGHSVAREQGTIDQAPHRPVPAAYSPLSPGDSSRSQNVSGLGATAYGVPAQTLTFGHSDQDASANTYSAKNIQSSTVFNSSHQPSLPSRSPSGNFADPRLSNNAGLSPAVQSSTLSSAAPGGGVTSMQDSRFNQQSLPNSGLSKSPQNPPGRSDATSFGGQSQSKPQSQSPGATTDHQQQQQQYSQQQSAAHHAVNQTMRQTGGYGSYGFSSDSTPRNTYSAFSNQSQQSVTTNATPPQKDGAISLQQQQQQAQLQQQTINASTGAAPRSSTTTSVFNTGSKPSVVPSASSLGFKPSAYPTQPNPAATQSLLGQQQQYLQQGQQQYSQQSTLPMFTQMYGSLEGMNDPRLQSVMQQPNMGLDYSTYQTPLPSRDLSGYSSADPSKYRSDPMSGVQTHVSQQGLVSPQMASPYQNYIFSPAAVAQNYAAYAPSAVYPQSLSSGYAKSGGSLGSSYPGSAYHDIQTLGDVNKASNAYGSSGLRGFGNDGYGNPGILGGSSDLNSAYYKSGGNKQFDKPAQNFGMHLPGGQQTTAAYGGQYYPNMMQPQQQQQQQLHQMGQVPQSNVGQNLGGNKPKGPSNQQYGQSWSHQ